MSEPEYEHRSFPMISNIVCFSGKDGLNNILPKYYPLVNGRAKIHTFVAKDCSEKREIFREYNTIKII